MRPRPRILAADDDPMNLAMLREILSEEFDLMTSTGGMEVVKMAHRFRPDLVLLDIMMPDLDGYEVCRRLRAEPGLGHLKIMLVSGMAQVSERVAGYEAGADDYVTKPFVLDEFLAKVRVYIRLKSIEEIDDLRGRFINLLGHETRTPLASILGAAEILATNASCPAATREQLASVIMDSAGRLKHLIERVTLLGDLQEGEVDVAGGPADVMTLLRSAGAAVTKRHAARDVATRIEGPAAAMVTASTEYLGLALESILDNAARFSPEGESIDVIVRAEVGGLSITITDRGPGVRNDLVPRIFDGFYVGDVDHHSSGHGLSLAIAQAILTNLEGDIELLAGVGNGATFCVTLPGRVESSAA